MLHLGGFISIWGMYNILVYQLAFLFWNFLNHAYHQKRTFVLGTFLFPYVLCLPSSLDLSALILISTCTWIQEAALESNSRSLKGKKYQVPRFLGNKYGQYTLLMFWLTGAFLKYENLCELSSGVHKCNHTGSFILYTASYFVWLPVYILLQEFHWTNAGWYLPCSHCMFMN